MYTDPGGHSKTTGGKPESGLVATSCWHTSSRRPNNVTPKCTMLAPPSWCSGSTQPVPSELMGADTTNSPHVPSQSGMPTPMKCLPFSPSSSWSSLPTACRARASIVANESVFTTRNAAAQASNRGSGKRLSRDKVHICFVGG